MLFIDSSKYSIDVPAFEKSIGVDGFEMYVDSSAFILLMITVEAQLFTARSLLEEKIAFLTEKRYQSITPNVISIILKDYLYIADSGLMKETSNGKISLDINKVFKKFISWCYNRVSSNPTLYSNAIEFCNLYIDYSQLKSLSESLSSKYKMLVPSDKIDNADKPLSKIYSEYTKRSTGRYYTQHDNLQGWNLESVSTFTAPKDYFFVWSDFDQIDLRVASNLVLFNGHPEVVDEFNRTDDKYEAVVRIISEQMNRVFDKEKFKKNRKSYKTAVLARLYGASRYTLMQDGFTDRGEIDMLDKYYSEHKFYQEYVSRFQKAISFGGMVNIEDYFGFNREIPIENNPYKQAHYLEQCLNTPIQSTSNDIVIIWVNELVKRFREKGFNEDKFKVALIRHDEGVFLLHKDTIPYLWLFEECGVINIDSWTPLTVKPSFGFKYKISNDYLTDLYHKSLEENKANLTLASPIGKPANRNWFPCRGDAIVYSFTPQQPIDFALYVLSLDSEWDSDRLILSEKVKKREKDTYAVAKSIIRDYMETGEKKLIKDYVNLYNKYYEYFVIKESDGGYKKISRSEFLPYLKDNNIGYVYFNNVIINSYSVVDTIQIRYLTGEGFDTIIQIMEEACNGER